VTGSAVDGLDDLLTQLPSEAGRNMRRTTIRSLDDLEDPRLIPVLRAARQERVTALRRE
jgi:hypothetical protein